MQLRPSQTGIAVDLGGTSVKVGIVDSNGEIVAQQTIPTLAYEGAARVLERIAETALALRKEAAVNPVALGMGIPGVVDAEAGITRYSCNIGPDWADFPVRNYLEPLVGSPVRIMNDARVATLGEWRFGHGKNTASRTLLFYSIGTGLGCGMILDGKLWQGRHGVAGELGHTIVAPGGRPCVCGNKGCLEAYVSGPALAGEGLHLLRSGRAPILNDLVAGDANKVDSKTMAEAAAAGDDAVHEAIIRMADHLALSIATMINAIHPEMVILGGGVANIGDLLLDAVRERVAGYVTLFSTDDILITSSALGDRAGLLGAGALALMDEKGIWD